MGVIERAASRKKAEVNVTAGQAAPDGTQIFEIKVGTLPDSTREVTNRKCGWPLPKPGSTPT